MTPDFKIIADSQDVTARLRDRLIELRVTDEAGLTSDAVEIRLDDRDNLIALPTKGAKLDVYLGYLETGIARLGVFTVDEVVPTGPPDVLTIRGRAADLRQGLKSPKTRSWDQVTIGALVATIAAEHGYTPLVAAELAGVVLPHLDQTAESDLNLLTRLARQYGAVAKPAGGRLLFVPAGQAKSASGKNLPAVALKRGDLTDWEATLADRGKYLSVVTRYRDLAKAVDVEVTVGSGEPVYQLRHSYPDRDSAIAAGRARLDAFTRGEGTLRFTCVGNNALAAEGKVTLSGVRDGVDGAWIATRVTHDYAPAAGYRCDVEGKTDAGN